LLPAAQNSKMTRVGFEPTPFRTRTFMSSSWLSQPEPCALDNSCSSPGPWLPGALDGNTPRGVPGGDGCPCCVYLCVGGGGTHLYLCLLGLPPPVLHMAACTWCADQCCLGVVCSAMHDAHTLHIIHHMFMNWSALLTSSQLLVCWSCLGQVAAPLWCGPHM
jgi:hypothetical protein